jgi:integrase
MRVFCWVCYHWTITLDNNVFIVYILVMGIFLQKGSRNWWISIYRDGRRRYVPTGTPDRDRALAVEALVRSAMGGNVARDKLFAAIDALMGWDAVSGVPIAGLWEVYLQTSPEVKGHTLDLRRKLVDRFVGWADEAWPSVRCLHEVTPQMAYAFSDWLWNELGGKGKTQNNRIGNVKAVFSAVVVRAGMESNPFSFVKKVPQVDSVHGRAFSAAEQVAIFERCRVVGNEWFEVSMVALYSGLRLVDLAALRWGDIDFEGGFLEVIPSKTRRHGVRVRIPLHVRIADLLMDLRAGTRPARTDAPVFGVLHERYAGGQHRSGYMQEVLDAVELDRADARISFHCWRHTFRTNLAAAGVSQEVAMQLGGWTDEKTAQIYNHDFSGARRAIAALD